MSNTKSLDVRLFTKNELLEVLKLHDMKEPDITKVILKNRINLVLDKLQQSNKDKNTKDSYVRFFDDVYKRLLTDLSLVGKDKKISNMQLEQLKVATTKKDLSQEAEIHGGNNIIIKHPDSQAQVVYPQSIFTGTINPLEKRVVTKLLNIDSKFREDYSKTKSTHFYLTLPSVINNVISMRLSSMEYPNTVNVFSEDLGTNKMQIYTIDANGGYTYHEVKVKEGNYSATEIVTYFNDIIFPNTVSTDLKYIETEYDVRYGKLIFKNKSDAPATFKFELCFRDKDDHYKDLKQTMGWMLGYRKYDYKYTEDYVTTATDTTFVGYNPEGMLDTWGPKYFLIVVNDYQNNVNDFYIQAYGDSLSLPNILGRVQQAQAHYSEGYDDGSDMSYKKREYYGPVNVERLEIRVIDEFGRTVDFNNMDLSLAIEMECVYNL